MLSKILPSVFDLVAIIFLAILTIILGNSHQLLSYYGFDSSSQVIKVGAGTAVNHGLTHLDTFKFTDTVVTFLIWALVGVFCFSMVRALATAYQEVKFEKQFSTNAYVHPSTFTKGKFWRQVATDFALLVLALVVTALSLYALVAFILPTAFAYTRTFLIGFALKESFSLLVGFGIIYVWFCWLDICARILVFHRKLTAI